VIDNDIHWNKIIITGINLKSQKKLKKLMFNLSAYQKIEFKSLTRKKLQHTQIHPVWKTVQTNVYFLLKI
jgi:hypothetical protein